MPPMGKDRILRIEKRKRLSQLFERGQYVCFDAQGHETPEEEGQWIERIFVSSPNPFQRDQAMREGQAARAKVQLDARENSTSKDWIAIRAFVSGLTDEELDEFLLNSTAQDRINEARRDVLTEKEWDDFNALRDAMRQYEEAGSPTDDPEWTSLLERDLAFGKQVTDRAVELRETAYETYQLLPRAKKEAKAVEVRVDNAGATAFVSVYEAWMMFFAVRDSEDHDVLMFDELEEYQKMPRHFQNAVAGALAKFIDESSEAKN